MDCVEENFVERYYEEYDDNDRYFDFIHDFYDLIHQYLTDRSIYILNENNFCDFFELCLNHMNRQEVDDYIISKNLKRLNHTNKDHNVVEFDEKE